MTHVREVQDMIRVLVYRNLGYVSEMLEDNCSDLEEAGLREHRVYLAGIVEQIDGLRDHIEAELDREVD